MHCICASSCTTFSGKSQSITIANENNRLSKEEIERMIREAEEFGLEDQQQRSRIEVLNSLSTSIYGIKKQLLDEEEVGGKFTDEERDDFSRTVQQTVEWVDDNGQTASVDDLEEKLSRT
jgi:heat shock protein 5